MIPDFPPPLVGGGGYHVYNLTRELVKKGVDVTVFTLNNESTSLLKGTKAETHFGKVKVFRVPAYFFPRTKYPVAPRLISLLLGENPDIVHAHGYQEFTSVAAVIASRIKKIPLVLTLHGFPRDFGKLDHRAYFNIIGKETVAGARRIISVSRLVAEEFKAIGISEQKMVIIPNGVNLEEYAHLPTGEHFRRRVNVKKNEKMVLAVGRLEEIKGFQCLIKSLPSILKEIGPTKLIIAGPEFDYGAKLRKLAEDVHVQDHVIFCGPVSGKEKFEAFSAADIVAVPSIYEGFGMLLLEAMAAGKPLVATKTGAAPELIQNGTNGILVALGDINDLARKIIKLLGDDKLMSFISQESRKTVAAFSWDKMATRIYKIYVECLASNEISLRAG